MGPKKKPNPLFIPAKTLPGRSASGPVNPRPINAVTKNKPRAPDLQDKGWVDQEKLVDLDRERQRKGLPSLKRNDKGLAEGIRTVEKQEQEQGNDENKTEEKKESRLSAEDKGKGKMPTLLELAAIEATTTIEASALPATTSLVQEKESIFKPALESIHEPGLEPSTEPCAKRNLETSVEPSVEPISDLCAESNAVVDVLEEQSEILWKLIDFFNSAPPLSDPPAQQPTSNEKQAVPPTPSVCSPPPSSIVPPALSPISSSPPALPSANTTPLLSDDAEQENEHDNHDDDDNGDDDDDGYWETMSFVWGDDEPMWQSGWDFPYKPAFTIYRPNPWTEPNHELNRIMTVEIPDGAFDEALWLRDLYDTNVASIANCKFEHPNNRPSANPFAPLQNSNNARGRTAADFYLNRDAIQKDLQEERPEWILSAYGPGRDAPEQLWGGMLEQSPEEMRLHAMTCEAAGNLQGALSDFEMLKTKAMEKISAAFSDPDAAINWIMSALDKQPNRLNVVTNNMNGEFAVGKRPVGFGVNSAFSATPANANPFGQPSAPAQNANPFKSGTSGFNQPSALGQAPSAFGQPATMGPGTGFGQTSALGQKTGVFGNSSALGTQNAFAQGTGFGQASALGPKPNPFGAPSPFAQSSQTPQTNAFGQPSQPAQRVPFGQPSQLGATPSPFSNAAANPGSSASPFSAFANNNSSSGNAFAPGPSSTNNVFAQPQQASTTEVSMGSATTPTSNTFAAAANPATNAGPFGQPQQTSSAFGQPPPANPFSQAQQPAFGQPAFGQPAQQKPNPFAPSAGPSVQPAQSSAAAAGPSANGPYGPNASRQHPAYASYAVKDPATGQLRTFKGRQVAYKEIDGKPTPGVQNMDGSFTKIWFPDGAPQYYQDTEPDREYTDTEKNIWQGFQQTGKFQLAATGGGGMPLAPPMRESVQWDF